MMLPRSLQIRSLYKSRFRHVEARTRLMNKKSADAAPAGKVRIGISGWRYIPWRGVFYPEKLSQKKELAYASGIFRSIEINGTFYSLQRPENFASGAAETRADFVFSVKGPRF